MDLRGAQVSMPGYTVRQSSATLPVRRSAMMVRQW